MHQNTHDQPDAGITILGAGPAGLTAALVLGRSGIPCRLIDKGHFPRPKICGDGLSGKVLDTLDRIDPAITARLRNAGFATPSRGVRFYSPSNRMVQVAFHTPKPGLAPGLICSRQDFDHFLLREALAHPAIQYLPGTDIHQVTRERGKWQLEARDGRVLSESGLLMLATGTDRRLSMSMGSDYPPMEREGIGIRAYFDHVSGSDEGHAIEIHFLKELLPWYFWIFPYQDGSANVGLALPFELAASRKESLRKLLFRLIEKYPHLHSRFSQSRLRGKVEAHRLPYYRGKMPLGGEGYVFLGDAACLVDPFTGEGISNAMVSGWIAGELVKKDRKRKIFDAAFAQEYETQLYGKLKEGLALGLRLQQLARKPRLLNLVIGRASRNEKVRALLEEMLWSMNTKGKLSRPMFYLKVMLGI